MGADKGSFMSTGSSSLSAVTIDELRAQTIHSSLVVCMNEDFAATRERLRLSGLFLVFWKKKDVWDIVLYNIYLEAAIVLRQGEARYHYLCDKWSKIFHLGQVQGHGPCTYHNSAVIFFFRMCSPK